MSCGSRERQSWRTTIMTSPWVSTTHFPGGWCLWRAWGCYTLPPGRCTSFWIRGLCHEKTYVRRVCSHCDFAGIDPSRERTYGETDFAATLRPAGADRFEHTRMVSNR